ncbi:MAG: hypothetical protein REI78_05950 [Pedobacter sp.]|nr:hypothetical protein [Pedobacter sp.]MDQ8052546.1 hypothetical protein [Pedobacter sp.]
MAIAKNNIVTAGLRGKLENVIFKDYSGKTVISRYPNMSNVVSTDRQQETRYNFRAAQANAKQIISDPDQKRAFQQSLPKGKTVYHAAIAKFLKENKL